MASNVNNALAANPQLLAQLLSLPLLLVLLPAHLAVRLA